VGLASTQPAVECAECEGASDKRGSTSQERIEFIVQSLSTENFAQDHWRRLVGQIDLLIVNKVTNVVCRMGR
jgi:hypothetical protein